MVRTIRPGSSGIDRNPHTIGSSSAFDSGSGIVDRMELFQEQFADRLPLQELLL